MRSNIIMGMLIISSCVLADQDSDFKIKNEDPQQGNELPEFRPIPIKPLHVPPVGKIDLANLPPLPDVSSEGLVQNVKDAAVPIDARPLWLYQSALDNAPKLLKGICAYWKNYAKVRRVSSYNRLILVGKPGTGKTTLAHAIGWHLGYRIQIVQASALLGRFRNQTATNIRSCFQQFKEDKRPTIIVIDEVHKLFELHKSEMSDDAMNAAAFWLALDMLEACAPHIIVIGTANSVSALPPEIQSRFHGKVITIPLPSKEHRLQALTEVIEHDKSIILGDSVDVAYIMKILDRLSDSSLRDIQLLLDGAKMFRYARGAALLEREVMVLEKEHFDQAVAQLRTESLVLQEGWRTKVIPALKNAALAFAVVVNGGAITKMIHEGIVFLHGSNNNGTQRHAQ